MLLMNTYFLCHFRSAAQSRVTAIGVELEQRESSLRQQLQVHQASSASEISKLKAEVARLTHELDISISQASSLLVQHSCHRMSVHHMCTLTMPPLLRPD